jgi:hypothetical protein
MKKKFKSHVHKLKEQGKRVSLRKDKESHDGLPRITNDTVAEHREEVLSQIHIPAAAFEASYRDNLCQSICYFHYGIFYLYTTSAI